jgi:hypothetical protein
MATRGLPLAQGVPVAASSRSIRISARRRRYGKVIVTAAGPASRSASQPLQDPYEIVRRPVATADPDSHRIMACYPLHRRVWPRPDGRSAFMVTARLAHVIRYITRRHEASRPGQRQPEFAVITDAVLSRREDDLELGG